MPIPKPTDGEIKKEFIARCMGDEVMLADYKDTEQRSGVCFSQWSNKEAKETKMLSDKNKSKLLQSALMSEYKIGQSVPIPKNLTIDEVFDDRVVYDVDGQLYEASYELDENGKAKLGEPKKVLSTKVYKTMEALKKLWEADMTMENKRALLTAALVDQLNLTKDEYIYVEDMTDAEVYYNRDQQSYKVNYTIAEDGTVTLGDSVKVTRQTVYKVTEALQSTYSEILQEAGRRNASLDSTRLKKIVALCQELLSSEAPDEEKVKEALKEAKATLKWVNQQAAMKTEDGVKFPAAAFAYTPSDNPDEWKLRLWESTENGITRTQLNSAAASLSPGGLRGIKAEIPAGNLSEVKRTIRAGYRKLNVSDDDMSKWVKEDMTRELVQNFVPLTEAKFDKGRATVIVIKPGFNASEDRYYPAEMLKRDYEVFEGQKMYADHPTEKEDKELPERSVKNTGWVAVLKDVKVDESGVVTGVAEIIESWLMTKLALLRDKELLSEMGISINAVGVASKATIDGKETLVIEKLTGARSVDFVTEPGAGGIVTFYESDRNRDIDLVELSALREKRPDLVKEIEAGVRAEITKEAKTAMDDKERITELEGKNETLTTENEGLKTKISEGEKEKAQAEAQATIKEAVAKAELPEASKERLTERFKDAESADGIEEAIQSEKDYIAKLSEAGKVKGLGPTKEQTDKDHEALKESFKRIHPEWTDGQLEAAVSGR